MVVAQQQVSYLHFPRRQALIFSKAFAIQLHDLLMCQYDDTAICRFQSQTGAKVLQAVAKICLKRRERVSQSSGSETNTCPFLFIGAEGEAFSFEEIRMIEMWSELIVHMASDCAKVRSRLRQAQPDRFGLNY
jgi:hypothetical protein